MTSKYFIILVFGLGLAQQSSGAVSVCTRTPAVVAVLEQVTGLARSQIESSNLGRITALRLDFSELTVLQDGDFEGLSALEELSMVQNHLTTLPRME